jgi:hypothetical protein
LVIWANYQEFQKNVSEQQQNATLKKLEESFGKVIITWNPNDRVPIFPPQEIQVQHPFMVNTTVSPEAETQAGTFNQTLEYQITLNHYFSITMTKKVYRARYYVAKI